MANNNTDRIEALEAKVNKLTDLLIKKEQKDTDLFAGMNSTMKTMEQMFQMQAKFTQLQVQSQMACMPARMLSKSIRQLSDF